MNLSYCPLLHTFNCSENDLSSIKIWGCENLTYIECQNNKLSACGLDSLFYLLPKKTDGNTYKIIVNKNPGTRFCCDTLATNRGWLVVTDYYTLVVNSEYDCPDFIHEEEEFAIKVYPNPVRDDLHIECSDKIESVKIYDALGRKIISKENTPNNTSIDFSNLGSGFYILKLRAAEGTEEFKVIKQ